MVNKLIMNKIIATLYFLSLIGIIVAVQYSKGCNLPDTAANVLGSFSLLILLMTSMWAAMNLLFEDAAQKIKKLKGDVPN